MTKVVIKELGKKVVNFYQELEKYINRIGTKTNCICCGEPFTIGEVELEKAKLDYKGNPKKRLELWNEQDIIFDVNLTETPIKAEHYTIKEQCVIFGVNCVNTKICHVCKEKNSEIHEIEHSLGRPDRCLAE